MIKAVLFDLDGTLVNSLIDLANGVNEALKANGFPAHDVEKYKYFVGDGIRKTIERALPEENRDNETVTDTVGKFNGYYSVHYADNTYPYDGVPELVAELNKRGYKLAVVTNKDQDMAEKVVTDAYGGAFKLIFGKREGLLPKPDPTAAILTMESLGVKPCECVFLGDSGVDILTGFNSGAYPVGELWGYREAEELKKNGAEKNHRKTYGTYRNYRGTK